MRRLLSGFLGVLAGMFALVGLAGLTGLIVSGLIALVVAILVSITVQRSQWIRIDAESCPPALRAVSIVAMGVALFQLSRLTVFMIAPSLASFSFIPASKWEVRHACTTAYYVAAKASGVGVSVYDDSLYTAPDDDPTKIRKPRNLESFNVDVYEYPPPFLLLPRALESLAPEFLSFRKLWFGVCAITLLVATLVVPRMLGPISGTRALLLSPLLWAALPTLSLLQKGNVQGFIIAISMLAMVLIHRGRGAMGGALLAFATLSKLFPGMLAVYLLAKRQWSALAWTSVFSVAFIAGSVLLFGPGMYHSFFEHLPKLLSGEAFPAFRNPSAIAMNFSIPTLLFKLKSFGVTGIDFPMTRVIGWLYTAAVVLVAVLAARRTRRTELEPLVWLGILILATLRSPFIPQAYAAVPVLWLLTLMIAIRIPEPKLLAGAVIAWVALNVYVPHDLGVDPRITAILNLAPLCTTLLLSWKALHVAHEPPRTPEVKKHVAVDPSAVTPTL